MLGSSTLIGCIVANISQCVAKICKTFSLQQKYISEILSPQHHRKSFGTWIEFEWFKKLSLQFWYMAMHSARLKSKKFGKLFSISILQDAEKLQAASNFWFKKVDWCIFSFMLVKKDRKSIFRCSPTYLFLSFLVFKSFNIDKIMRTWLCKLLRKTQCFGNWISDRILINSEYLNA